MTANISPSPRQQDRWTSDGAGTKWRAHAELLRSTLARLCDQPAHGSIWNPPLLAAEAHLPMADVELALDPGRQRDHKSSPELAPWPVYDLLLHTLRAGPNDCTTCQAAHEALTRYLQSRVAPPPDIAAIVDEEDFMKALAALMARSGLSLRKIASAMRELDAAHAWTRGGLEPYYQGKKLPPRASKERLRTLLSVLCKETERPPEDVDHYLAAWEDLQPRLQGQSAQPQPRPPAPAQERTPPANPAPAGDRTLQLTHFQAALLAAALLLLIVTVAALMI